MAPPSKKAKKEGPKPAAGGGLSKFFAPGALPAQPAVTAAVQVEQKPKEAAAEPQAAATPQATETPQVAAAKPQGLTDEQQTRIEENKRAAIAKKRAREAKAAEDSPPPAPAVSPNTKSPAPTEQGKTTSPEKTPVTNRVVAGSQTTPEKSQPIDRKLRDLDFEKDSSCRFGRLQPMTKWVQFNSLYNARLSQLKGAALDEARRLWGGMVEPEGFMSDLGGYKKGIAGAEVVVAGVLFKDMKKRPNVIAEILEAKSIASLTPSIAAVVEEEHFATDSDVLWLEENGMRVQLVVTKEQLARHATGFVIAARGSATKDGRFRMSGFCFPRTEATAPIRPSSSTSNSFVAFLSGLEFGSSAEGLGEARAKALTFLRGKGEEAPVAISRIVVCGGCFAEQSHSSKDSMKVALKEADSFLAQLAAAAPLNVMPSQGDPTNAALPQRALHPYLFKDAWASKNFKAVSNPYSYDMDGVNFLGHSGLPVRDLMRCATFSSPLEALTYCLEARHIAPTAPDTLPTQPFADIDPFVIDKVPHVFFSGGQHKFEHLWRPCPRGGDSGTQCICLPSFSSTSSIVLVSASDPRVIMLKEFGK